MGFRSGLADILGKARWHAEALGKSVYAKARERSNGGLADKDPFDIAHEVTTVGVALAMTGKAAYGTASGIVNAADGFVQMGRAMPRTMLAVAGPLRHLSRQMEG